MMLLAERERDGDSGAASLEIAREMDIPYRFLRKLVKRMVAARLVNSQRGKGGGLTLGREAGRITLYDVLQAMSPMATRLSNCRSKGTLCSRARICGMHRAIHKIQGSVDRQLRDVTIASLVG
jgi:Rrf2 family protein